jgi:hypothetical protein
VAAHLGLRPVDGIHLPTPVNFIFIGFNRDGHLCAPSRMRLPACMLRSAPHPAADVCLPRSVCCHVSNVSLSEEELRLWVDHMDHVLPHARRAGGAMGMSTSLSAAASTAAAAAAAAPPGAWASGGGADADADARAAAAAEEAEEAAAEAAAAAAAAPLFDGESYVSYNFSIHAVEFNRAVTAVIERAIGVLARPLDPKEADAAAVSRAAAAAAAGTPFPPGVWYHVDARAMGTLLESLLAETGLEGGAYNIVILNPKRIALPERYGYRTGFSAQELSLLGAEWETHNMEAAVRGHAMGRPPPGLDALRAAPSSPGAPGAASAGASRRWLPPRSGAKFSWSNRVWDADAWAARANKALDEMVSFRKGLAPSAILRHEAAATLAGGDAAAARALRRALAHTHGGGGGAGGAQQHADCLADTHVSRGRVAFADLSAGPLGWGPASGGGAGLRRGDIVSTFFGGEEGALAAAGAPPHDELEDALDDIAAERYNNAATSDEQSGEEASLVEAELDVYEAFAASHCRAAVRRPPLCDELRARVTALEEELAAIEAEEARDAAAGGDAGRAFVRKPRPHQWCVCARA